MVGTRSPALEEAEGAVAGSNARAGAAATNAAPSPSTFVNEATLDSLVVEWLKEEKEEQKVKQCFVCVDGSEAMCSRATSWFRGDKRRDERARKGLKMESIGVFPPLDSVVCRRSSITSSVLLLFYPDAVLVSLCLVRILSTPRSWSRSEQRTKKRYRA